MIRIRWKRQRILAQKRKSFGDRKKVAESKIIESKLNLIRKLKLNKMEKNEK